MAENDPVDPNHGLIDMPDLNDPACFELYNELYTRIKTSQDGDGTISLDTRIKNIAYNLASPIVRVAGSSSGEIDPSDPQLLNYVKRKGDSMTGRLGTLYGLDIGDTKDSVTETIAKTVFDSSGAYMQFLKPLKVESENFYLNGKNVFLLTDEGLVVDGGDNVSFVSSYIKTIGGFIAGNNINDGFYASPTQLTFQGGDVYHSRNSNLPIVDWAMNDANVSGNLSVAGEGDVTGLFSALGGAVLGYANNAVIDVTENLATFIGDIDIQSPYGIKFSSSYVISRPSDTNIQIEAVGDALILGGNNTESVRLWSTLTTEAGDHELIDKFGNASFLNSFEAGKGYGGVLMKTHNDGVIMYNRLMFGNELGPYLIKGSKGLCFSQEFIRENDEVITHGCDIHYGKSTSIHADLDRYSETLFLDTTADFFTYNKPIEAKEFIGITKSTTRLYDNTLFFNDNHYLLNITDGIRHFGNSYFMGNLFSERFSTGFAGEGFAIRKRVEDGNYEMTTDYMFVRKKFTTYEMEVQKISVINGSLWVSSSCSGDSVTKVE